MSEQSLREDPEFQKLPQKDKVELIRQYRRETQGAYASIPGVAPDVVRPPQRTGTPLEEFNQPFTREAINAPTLTETYLPKNIATTALSGLERGVRTLAAPFVGAGRVLEQLVEQAPRLIGGEPESTPISRVAPDVPGLLVMPTSPKVPDVPVPPVAAGPRQALANLANRAVFRPTPESRAAAQAGRETGIPLTIAEARDSPGWAKLERTVERYPIGGGQVRDFREGQRAATVRQAEGVGPDISQTQSSPLAAGQTIRDVAGGEVRMADVAEESRQAARTAATSAAAQGEATATLTGFGPPTTLETVTTKAKSVLKQAEDAARAEASRRYDEIESLAGDAPVVRMTQTGERAKEILADEAQMSRLAKPTITRAAGAAEDVAGTGAPTVHLGGVATSLQSLPREIIEALGLDRAEAVTFKQARTLESRIGGLLRSTTDDYVKRQLRFLRDAVRQDVEAFTQSAPGDLGVKLRDANEFYRTRVAMPFGADSDIRTLLNQTEPAKIEAMLFDKRGAERLLGIKAEMDRLDPTAWALVRSRFGDRLMREAVDPTTNLFSDEKFARAVAQYPPEVIRAVLGDKATNLARLVEGYQAAGRAPANVVSPIQASAIFREYAKKVPEDIVASLGTLQPSEIRSIKEKLGPAAWGPIGRAWWEHAMLPKSHGKEEMFSRSRFLTQLKKTNPETLRELLGAEATDGLARLRAVLERQERVHPLGDNPSGTAQALMGSEQLWKIVQVGGAVAMGKVAGITSGGAVLLTPALMARLLSSPRGIRLFTEGVMAPQGSKSAQDAALRIGIFLSSQSTPEQQESAPVPMR